MMVGGSTSSPVLLVILTTVLMAAAPLCQIDGSRSNQMLRRATQRHQRTSVVGRESPSRNLRWDPKTVGGGGWAHMGWSATGH